MAREPETGKNGKRGLQLVLAILRGVIGFILGAFVTVRVGGFILIFGVVGIAAHAWKNSAIILAVAYYAIILGGGIAGAVIGVKAPSIHLFDQSPKR